MRPLEGMMIRSERWMYASGRPNRLAAVLNRLWAVLGRAGIGPHRLVTLEVAGRRSGRAISIPLIAVAWRGERYLVSMLGEGAEWVANVRAAGGRADLSPGRRAVRLVEVAPGDRAPIIREHLRLAPAARSFVSIDRHAPLAEFARVADEVPVFRVEPLAEADVLVARRPRRFRWLRWLALGLGALVVLSIVGVGVYLRDAEDPRLALPTSVNSPRGEVDGEWSVARGSVAGFRMVQNVPGMSGDVTGRTAAVSGSMVIQGDSVTNGAFEVDLTTITYRGKAIPQVGISLVTDRHPAARFNLREPVRFGPDFVVGRAITATAAGELTLRGKTRPVTASVSAQRDGASILLLVTIPVALGDWGVEVPQGYGALGSIADHGSAEALVVLTR